MNTIAIIISLIALVGAGFAFLRASSSHRILGKRIERLKDYNSLLEERLKRVEGGRGKRSSEETAESGRGRNLPRQEQAEQTREPRQKQRDRQPQERQAQREERQPQERQQERKSQREDESQPGQQRRKKENRRRNEPMDRNRTEETGNPEQHNPGTTNPVNLEFAGGDLLAELEQVAAGQQTTTANQISQPEPVQNGKKYAIIPEDGVIRQHQLQQQPDSDSYIEVDAPAEGSSRTHYRFNLAGNHAFVISQGIDRLENAFSFEKPSNRMVSQVVQQRDGILAKVGNGWKIEEKARIDFR